MNTFLRRSWQDVAVLTAFLLLSFLYFAAPVTEGLVLGGHDTVAGMGLGQEQVAHHAATGHRPRWTNSAFSGMPTYQIAPTYAPTETLAFLGRALSLGITGPVAQLFLYLLGCYILLRAFRVRPLLSAFGAVGWAFSSYLLIIIAAGHLWKVNTLAFIPPTIAGLVLAYRGRLLWGGVVTTLFTALQILSNHLQMTYYFLFLMGLIVLCYGVEACRKGALAQWSKATGTIVLGGVLGALINLPGLYHTWEYSKESMRGQGELTAKTRPDDGSKATGGLERDYITAWSYGVDESLTLLIANFKGGGSQSITEREGVEDLDGYDDFYRHAAQLQQAAPGTYLPGTAQYWGDQPMTVGPVYVGAIVCFLFVLALFLVEGPIKWALLLATMISFFFAWGKNTPGLTDFFIDHLPLYAKFRTVSSALVVAELTMPLLAALGLARVLKEPEALFGTRQGRIGLGVSLAATAGVCLLFALAPELSRLLSEQDQQMFAQMQAAGLPADFVSGYRAAVTQMHAAMLSADAWRSFLLVAVAAALVAGYARFPRSIPASLVGGLLLVITLADLWNVDRRYLNEDSFVEPETRAQGFSETPADRKILQDPTLHYRVLNLSQGNPFNETTNQTSYRHKSIGGYHPAKLHRYQDLIDRYLLDECAAVAKAVAADSLAAARDTLPGSVNTPVLNMLNARWCILDHNGTALRNTSAAGNAWFIDTLRFVDNADAEIDALKGLNPKRTAVADRRFAPQLAGSTTDRGTAVLNRYAPDELHYTVGSKRGGVVVFSEIYYPGWTAEIDGKAAELGRVDYVLRALRVPAGTHRVVLRFRPTSIAVTNAVGYGALALLGCGFLLLGVRAWRRREA